MISLKRNMWMSPKSKESRGIDIDWNINEIKDKKVSYYSVYLLSFLMQLSSLCLIMHITFTCLVK